MWGGRARSAPSVSPIRTHAMGLSFHSSEKSTTDDEPRKISARVCFIMILMWGYVKYFTTGCLFVCRRLCVLAYRQIIKIVKTPQASKLATLPLISTAG